MHDFSKKYNRKEFLTFLRNFLPDDFSLENEEYKDEPKGDLFRKIYKLGKIESFENLVILEVEHTSSSDPRIVLTKKVFSLFNKLSINKALVIFYCADSENYRFSLVESSYKWTSDTAVTREFSLPKRLSFFLGPEAKLHTPYNQLKNKVKNYTDLKNRFDIEVVNEEFFENYKKLFLNLKEKLDKDKIFSSFLKKNKLSSEFFSKRLLGQIVFCYFLQKKKWLGVSLDKNFGTGDNNYLRNQFNIYNKSKKNFFNEFLEYFFYEGLNDRNENHFVKTIYAKVPYIGGGLFEYFEGYDWKKENLNIPNSFFSNDEQNGILDIFDLYNFTVDENEDFDVDIAVDPEMLGRVFENLLPENIRKGGGSYYTPRVIVNYMCETSLIYHLHQKLFNNISYKQIENFVRSIDSDISNKEILKKNAEKIDKILQSIKICDPAIGSGAFAVAIVNLISRLRTFLKDFVNRKYKNNSYYFKRDCIQSSIYGVDIDNSAVEIAKLRLWLSLIVDEKDYNKTEPLPNLDFQIIQGNSLINEVEGYNFQHLDIEEKDYQFELLPNDVWEDFSKTKEKFINLKKKYFDTKSYEHKKLAREEIETLLLKITSLAFSLSNRLNKKNNIDENSFKKIRSSKNFFLWKLYFIEIFQDQPGFDVIITNPPYIGEKGNSSKFQEVRNASNLRRFYQRKMDYYYFFFHLVLDILKEDGILNFITTSYFTTSTAGKNLRSDIKSRSSFLEMINFNELKIFKSAQGQHNMISTIIKNVRDNSCKTIKTSRDGYANAELLNKILYYDDEKSLYKKINSKNLFEGTDNYIRLEGNITSEKNIENDILKKMLKDSNLLSSYFDVDLGLQSGLDKVTKRHIDKFNFLKPESLNEGVYVINSREYKKMQLKKAEKEICRKMYKNSDVHKYYTNNNTDKYIFYLTRDLEIDDYPNIKRRIFKFEKLIKTRSIDRGEIQAALKMGKWWVIYSAKSRITFEGKKIVCPQRSKLNTFAYHNGNFYANRDVYYIRNKKMNNYDLKALTATLNSRLFYFWLLRKGKLKGSSLELYSRPLSEIPIKMFDENSFSYLSNCVQNILDDPTEKKILENDIKINNKINELYQLSEKEISYINALYPINSLF